MIIGIGYVDVARTVRDEAERANKLSIARSFTSPLGNKRPVAIKLLYAVIPGIGYIDVARVVYG